MGSYKIHVPVLLLCDGTKLWALNKKDLRDHIIMILDANIHLEMGGRL